MAQADSQTIHTVLVLLILLLLLLLMTLLLTGGKQHRRRGSSGGGDGHSREGDTQQGILIYTDIYIAIIT